MHIVGRILPIIIFCFPLVAQAQTRTTLVRVDTTGTAFLNQTAVADGLHVDQERETILIPLVSTADGTDSVIEGRLSLPVIMAAEWKPRLIPSRCSCETQVTRVDAQNFSFLVSGVTTGASVSLEAIFPPGTFKLSATARAALGAERASPWLLALALIILLGSFGLIGWMIYELAAIRKFRLTPTLNPTPPTEEHAAIVSLIPSGKITAATLAAMLIDLAQRGYIQISYTGTHFTFKEGKPLDLTGPGFALGSLPGDEIPATEIAKAKKEGVSMAEKYFLSKLFTQGTTIVTEAQLRQRFSRRLSSWKIGKVYAELYKEVAADGFFIRNPHEIHLRYRGLGILIFFIGLLGFAASFLLPGNTLWIILTWALIALTGYIITRMVPFLPLLTVMGQAEWARWGGFRLFLADAQPISVSNPNKIFFAYLPYAFAFNELEAWSHRFTGRMLVTPHWYQTDPPTQPIETIVKELEELKKQVANVLAAMHEHTVL